MYLDFSQNKSLLGNKAVQTPLIFGASKVAADDSKLWRVLDNDTESVVSQIDVKKVFRGRNMGLKDVSLIYASPVIRDKLVGILNPGTKIERELVETMVSGGVKSVFEPKKYNSNYQFKVKKVIAGEISSKKTDETKSEFVIKNDLKNIVGYSNEGSDIRKKHVKKSSWFDKLVTLIIGGAVIFSLAYLMPGAFFDWFRAKSGDVGVNIDGTLREVELQEVDVDGGSVPVSLNMLATELMKQDLSFFDFEEMKNASEEAAFALEAVNEAILSAEQNEDALKRAGNAKIDEGEINENIATLAVLMDIKEISDEKEVNEILALQAQKAALPPVNPDLPEGKWIIVSKIGLNAQIRDDQNLDEALAQGVVQISGFGQIGQKSSRSSEGGSKPVILAAHRFGFKWWWNSDYARQNSFYYLPELVVGDQISLIDGQREWKYEIYDSYEGKQIDNYEADLILYTCRFLNSDIRYFRYARLVN